MVFSDNVKWKAIVNPERGEVAKLASAPMEKGGMEEDTENLSGLAVLKVPESKEGQRDGQEGKPGMVERGGLGFRGTRRGAVG